MRLVLALGALLGGSLVFAQSPPSEMDLYLLIGQSNMAGRGVVSADDRQPIPGIWVQAKDLSWKPAVDPLHYDKPDIAAVGLGRSFAKTVAAARAGGAAIGLIPAAFGGSALNEWKPGAIHYVEAVRRAKAAMQNGKLRGILWHQGEADSADPALLNSYVERFSAMMRQLRVDLNANDVPVVVGEVGRFYKNQAGINAQLAKVPAAVPRCGIASSEGLADKGDVVHFDTPSLYELGKRYAAAFLRLSTGAPSGAGIPNWKTSKEFTIAVAEKMPEADYQFHPVSEEMTFDALMYHIAFAQAFRIAQAAGSTNPLPPPGGKLSKPEIIAALGQSFDFCIATLPTLTPEQLSREHEVNWYGTKITTGSQIVLAMLVHTAHHRGQAEVYLRVKGIAPPTYRF